MAEVLRYMEDDAECHDIGRDRQEKHVRRPRLHGEGLFGLVCRDHERRGKENGGKMLIDVTCAYVAGGGHGKGESTRYVVTCGVDC